MSSSCCPLCGSTIAKETGLKVYNGAAVVIVDGVVVKLSPTRAAVFNQLYLNYPKHLNYADIAKVLPDSDASEKSLRNTVPVHISNINKLLKASRLRIINDQSYGYKLDLKQGHHRPKGD